MVLSATNSCFTTFGVPPAAVESSVPVISWKNKQRNPWLMFVCYVCLFVCCPFDRYIYLFICWKHVINGYIIETNLKERSVARFVYLTPYYYFFFFIFIVPSPIWPCQGFLTPYLTYVYLTVILTFEMIIWGKQVDNLRESISVRPCMRTLKIVDFNQSHKYKLRQRAE